MFSLLIFAAEVISRKATCRSFSFTVSRINLEFIERLSLINWKWLFCLNLQWHRKLFRAKSFKLGEKMRYVSELHTWQIVERLKGTFCGIVLLNFSGFFTTNCCTSAWSRYWKFWHLQWQWLGWCGVLRMSVLAFGLTFQMRNNSCHVTIIYILYLGPKELDRSIWNVSKQVTCFYFSCSLVKELKIHFIFCLLFIVLHF